MLDSSQVWGFSNLRVKLDYTDPKLKARNCHLRGERYGITCACAPTGQPRPNNCAYRYRPNLRVQDRSFTYTLLGVMKQRFEKGNMNFARISSPTQQRGIRLLLHVHRNYSSNERDIYRADYGRLRARVYSTKTSMNRTALDCLSQRYHR